ncbi:hypothetical protein [Paenibacillus alvei]|uniref:hypothetical protein n=1 Tax=Paenibacillus alvei TaxID=44250 RepID=UPI002280F189|nr:hypothetical protein [Paenibacillus alvei]MCY7487911.1 hypothetical protein [Paenibacillus alvei]
MKSDLIEYQMQFIEENKGVKADKPFHVIKLGDPLLCESATFFLGQNSQIKTALLAQGQKVKAFFKLEIYQGRMGVRLVDLVGL